MRFQVVLEPSDEGGYTVYVPSLPGCVSEGDTVEDALTNIREAVELYLEPVEDDWIVEKGVLVSTGVGIVSKFPSLSYAKIIHACHSERLDPEGSDVAPEQ